MSTSKPKSGVEPSASLNRFTIGVVTDPVERVAIFGVRMLVFVEEQQVPAEEELDAYDETATHFYMSDNAPHIEPRGKIVATARLLNKGQGLGKIGRVAVLKEYRGMGNGASLMRFVETHARSAGYQRLALEAQCYAIPFYEGLGYIAEGEVFLDAGIEHRLMQKPLS